MYTTNSVEEEQEPTVQYQYSYCIHYSVEEEQEPIV